MLTTSESIEAAYEKLSDEYDVDPQSVALIDLLDLVEKLDRSRSLECRADNPWNIYANTLRIDRPAIELIDQKLKLQEPQTDAELILHAYEAWGDDCVKHLIGDFAFAIWDERQQRLFCARDHFGVKPFYYTHIEDRFNFSSSLNELRLDQRVSNTLNEIAVGDYLLFGVNQDLSTTVFKDIQRLPPGHTLTVANGSITIQRYWTPEPLTPEMRFRDPDSYVERFSELLARAVKDRVTNGSCWHLDEWRSRFNQPGCNCARTRRRVTPSQLFTTALIPDEERHYSTFGRSTSRHSDHTPERRSIFFV